MKRHQHKDLIDPMSNMQRVIETRAHILNLLEQGRWQPDEKLPGARDLADALGISFVKVQAAIESLVQDGVLYTVPRRGTFVQALWRERTLADNFSLFNPVRVLPWVERIRPVLAETLPELRITDAFAQAVFELRTTYAVQRDQAEYMDLTDVLADVYPDMSAFFSFPFQPFRLHGRLVGIPFIFSPRVLFYNPGCLEKAGVPLPDPDWDDQAFLECLRRLRKTLPADRIFNWTHCAYQWMNWVVRAGGDLFDPANDSPIRLDDLRTRRGLVLHAAIRRTLQAPPSVHPEYQQWFARGECAFYMGDRQNRCLFESLGNTTYAAVPLPRIEGGSDLTMQATDLLCVRKNATDPDLIRRFVATMLSPCVQDAIADARYGIPIRKSSAARSFDLEDPRDTLFVSEMNRIRGNYNIDSPELARLVTQGVEQALLDQRDIDEAACRIADAARVFLGVREPQTA